MAYCKTLLLLSLSQRMIRNIIKSPIFIGLASSVLLSACSSQLPTEKEQAAVAPANIKLSEVNYSSDEKGVQWVSKDLAPEEYTNIIVQPVSIDLKEKRSEQIPQDVLVKISDRITETLKSEMSSDVNVVSEPDAHTGKLSIVIYEASTGAEDAKVTDFIPVGAVIDGIAAAVGHRSQTVRLVIEAKVTDSITGKLLAERISVIKENGLLSNEHVKLTYDEIHKRVDGFVKEMRTFVQSAVYSAKQKP